LGLLLARRLPCLCMMPAARTWCELPRTRLPRTRVDKAVIKKPSGNVEESVGTTHRPPKLPKGYRLDLASDPDAPALRRPDGTVVARFGAGGMMHEAL
jgi:hypothetical protein